ncbi:hypothetical protein R1flu_007023 [Riccia fluitans]|uniref:Uncharacterized protein n=1 Tax=Riccia fluitans TaxID=41844 RepID=A0ABD1Z0D3_9MARC
MLYRLAESIVRSWFVLGNKRQLKTNVQTVINNWDLPGRPKGETPTTEDGQAQTLENLPTNLHSQRKLERSDIWKGLEELEKEYQLLIKLCAEGTIVNYVTLRCTTQAFFQVKAPEHLLQNGGLFDVSRSWVRNYL